MTTNDRLKQQVGFLMEIDRLKQVFRRTRLIGQSLPAMIMTAELRQTVHGLPLPTFGHRAKFGNDPRKHIEFSAVTHVAKGKGIPPFLILHVAEHPDVTAQARRLGAALQEAGIPATVFGARETTHRKISTELGLPDDPATQALFRFLDPLVPAER